MDSSKKVLPPGFSVSLFSVRLDSDGQVNDFSQSEYLPYLLQGNLLPVDLPVVDMIYRLILAGQLL